MLRKGGFGGDACCGQQSPLDSPLESGLSKRIQDKPTGQRKGLDFSGRKSQAGKKNKKVELYK